MARSHPRGAAPGIAALAAALATALLLSGCGLVGGGPKYSAEELMTVWKAHSESANWDLEVRDVVGQRKSTGSHDADYTIFLTTYTSKKVPGFKLYETVDIPNDDSMTFEERANAFFDVIKYGSEFTGVQDIEGFMRFFAEKYPERFFIRLIQNSEPGKVTWQLVALDSAPTQSTMTGEGRTDIYFTYDEKTKKWSEAK